MDDVPLVRLLSMAVTVALESLHEELARAGHPTLRPAHGYALHAVSTGVDTASRLPPVLRAGRGRGVRGHPARHRGALGGGRRPAADADAALHPASGRAGRVGRDAAAGATGVVNGRICRPV